MREMAADKRSYVVMRDTDYICGILIPVDLL